MSRYSLAILTVVHLGCGSGGGGDGPDAAPPDARPPQNVQVTYDVSHYDFAVDLATRDATVDLTLDVLTAGDCVTIGFRPDVATAVRFDGVPARDVVVAADTLTACEGTGLGWLAPTGVTMTVQANVPLETWAASQVGYSVWTDLTGKPYTYMVSWVGGCDRHGPCDAAPDHFATYKFTVTHPAGTQVLCSGAVTAGPTQTVCDFAVPGGPSYSTFAFMAGQSWTESSLGSWNGVAVELYDYAATGIKDAFDTDAASAHFAWLEDTFGAYPYGNELRFVIGPTYWAGFEHPGNISLSETLAMDPSSYANGLTHTILHEVAHQWAGDHTSLASTYDFVWKEAMAEYLTFVTEDERMAPGVSAQTTKAWKTWSSYAQYFLVPAEQPPLLTYYGDVYGPGPMIFFHQLEVIYGRAPVIQALQALIGQPEQRALSVDDVQAALETALGVDLTVYFDGWVHGTGVPGFPRAAVSVTDMGGGAVQVAVDVTTADGKPRGCNFHVRLTGAAGETFDVPVALGIGMTPFTPVTVTPGWVVTGNTLDPLSECLVYRATFAKPERTGRGIEPWRAGSRQ